MHAIFLSGACQSLRNHLESDNRFQDSALLGVAMAQLPHSTDEQNPIAWLRLIENWAGTLADEYAQPEARVIDR